MIADLMTLQGITTRLKFKGDGGLITACKKLETFRDMIAHGVWAHHENSKTPIFQSTAGSYQEEGKSVKARIAPRALNISLDAFRQNAKASSAVLKAVDFLGKELKRQLAASQKRHPQRFAPGPSPHNPRKSQNPANRYPRRK